MIPSVFFFLFFPAPCVIFVCPLLFLPSYVRSIHTFSRSRPFVMFLRPLFLLQMKRLQWLLSLLPPPVERQSRDVTLPSILKYLGVKSLLKTLWRPDGFKYGPRLTIICLALSSLIQITASGEQSDKARERSSFKSDMWKNFGFLMSKK